MSAAVSHNNHSGRNADAKGDNVHEEEGVGIIHPIEVESVRRIVAGQAVTDLASAVKELVDNALDANSQSINIRLFNQGLDIVEVSDDGSGVPPASRPFVAHPHATSKIRSFEDIYASSTDSLSFGFRGEALFCLANLSERLVVATRTAAEPVGQQMEFHHDGTLKRDSVAPVPRKVGTTVAVVKLLSSLPVRRSDLVRRVSQQRAKLMRLMEGYAIFSVGVRLNLMDMVGKRENTLLATQMNTTSLQQTVSSVLGSKFLSTVMPITIDLADALPHAPRGGEWKVEGLVSKSPNGNTVAGAKTGQQYFSINGRPVELPKIARLLGDVWRSMGGKKKPSCVLTLWLPNNEYDVNLSPEKRQVMLTHEAQVCQAIQERVVELWNQQTQGQFTPGAAASQPTYSQSTLQTTQLKSEGAAATTSSRKRPREEKTATAVTEDLDYGYGEPDERDSEKDGHNDNKDDEEQMGCGYEEHAPKRSYYHRQRREQEEQMTLNAAGGDIDCQYGEEHPSHRQHCENQQLQEQQRQAALLEDEMTSPERRRVQRRGGFVHDISTAKQFERPPPTPIDEHFTMPPIDDEEKEEADDEEVVNQDDMDTEDEVEEAPANKKRAAEDSPVPTERNETTAQMMMSSRRVTLTLNNNLEVTEEIPPPQVPVQDQEGHRKSNASDTSLDKTPNHSIPATSNDDEFAAARQNEVTKDATPSDDDRRLWIEARTRFNQRDSVDNSLEEEIDVLVKSSKRPDKASQEATETPQVTPILRQDADQQEGDMARTKSLNLSQFACQTSKIRSKEIHVTPGRHPADTGHKKESSMCQSNREMEEISNDKESSGSSPVKEPETVIWGTFQGTEQVVAMARMERHRMLERKRALKEVRPNSSLEEDDGNEVATGVDPNKKICLSKGDFSGMTVLGQFNLGFILAKDSSNHLWIFDQHACDERYNFEKLMAETIIHEQKLIAPMSLELDPSEESCILDHMAIFEKNGFRFKYEPDKPPRHRLALTALPHSGARDGRRAVQFGKEDVSALCAILGCRDTSYDDEDNGFYTNDGGTGTDGSGLYGNNAVRRHASSFSQGLGGKGGDTVDKVLTRLPKAIAMFASRACRSSVMIGTALSNKEMEKIIKRLNDLNDPWNCAHGRPTMTHITDLHPGLLKDERRAAEHIAGPT